MLQETRFTLRTMGSPRVEGAQGEDLGLASGKPLAVLAFVLHHPDGVSRSQLTQLFWPSSDPKRARASLRQTLWVLRQALGSDLLLSDDPVVVDPEHLETDLKAVDRALASGDVLQAAKLYSSAPFDRLPLPDVSGWSHWTDEVRSSLELRLGNRLLGEADSAFRKGDAERALQLATEAARVMGQMDAAQGLCFEASLMLRRLDEAERFALGIQDEARRVEALGRIRAIGAGEISTGASSGRQRARLPFTGRDREYRVLLGALRQVQEGAPKFALIRGPAGAGKTRLVEELIESARAQGVRTVRIKATEGNEALSLGLVADAAQQLMTMEGAAGVSLASDAALRSLLPSTQRPHGGLDRSQGGSRAESVIPPAIALADSLLDLVCAVGEEGPMLLFLDDLQWADAESRRVFRHVQQRLRGVPVMLIAALRSQPGREEGGRAAGNVRPQGLSDFIRIDLGAWGQEDVIELLSKLTGHVGDHGGEDAGIYRISRQLFEAGAGNPLFTEELLGVLEDMDVVRSQDGAPWEILRDSIPEEQPLPRKLADALGMQLERLSVEAAKMAGWLATAKPATPATMGRAVGLRAARRDRGLSELLTRGVVRWGDDGQIHFVHDEMRREAERRFASLSSRQEEERHRRRVLAGIAASLFLVLMGAAYLNGVFANQMPKPPRFGGGSIYLVESGGVQRFEPGDGPVQDWASTSVETDFPLSGSTRGPFLDPSGGLLWMDWVTATQTKPWVAAWREGRREEIYRTPGDDFVQDVSPDGSWLLVTSEPRSGPASSYRLDLVAVEIATGVVELLHEGQDRITTAVFSPDGTRIAAILKGRPDTVLIMDRRGKPVHARTSPRALDVTWCGSEQMIFLEEEGATSRLVAIDARSANALTLPQLGHAMSSLACSPDGSGLLYASAINGKMGLVVQDLESGASEVLVEDRLGLFEVRWIPSERRNVPAGLSLGFPEGPIQWGQSVDLKPQIGFFSGHVEDVGAGEIRLESSNSSVISVGSDGRVFANSPGTAVISGIWGEWLEDEYLAEVVGTTPPSLLLDESAETLLDGRWLQVGAPPVRRVRRDGEEVLLLDGDALFIDGLLEAKGTQLPRGGTVEIDFRAELTRTDKQWIAICLVDGDPPPIEASSFEMVDISINQATCFRYPGEALSSFDPAVGVLAGPGISLQVALGEDFSTTDWTHLALQVRPDGQVTAVVNNRPVQVSPIYLKSVPETPWRVFLYGASWQTEVLVRALRLWEGERY